MNGSNTIIDRLKNIPWPIIALFVAIAPASGIMLGIVHTGSLTAFLGALGICLVAACVMTALIGMTAFFEAPDETEQPQSEAKEQKTLPMKDHSGKAA